MRILTCLAIASPLLTIALTTPAQAQTPVPTPPIVETEAKRELYEAARAYREGNFAEAQAHSERALLLDPQSRTALIFVARTTHAQYKPGDVTPENAVKARQAIVAYHRVLEKMPGDDEAYKAVAYLYGALKEEGLLRAWILQRALDVSMANEKRAEAFVVLASKDWDCSFKITELPGNKVTTVKRGKAYVQYKLPEERVEFERAKECADRGLEMVNGAITLAPDNESAWAYKTNILSELAKQAEMLGKLRLRRELSRQYDEALSETTRLSKRSQSNP